MRWSCGNLRGPAHIRNCYIHGECRSGFGVFDSSIVENCHFTGNVENGWLEAYRHSTVIRNNTFGPGNHGSFALYDYSRGGNDTIQYNIFNCTSSAYKIGLTSRQGLPVVCQYNVITDTSEDANHVASMLYDDTIGEEGIRIQFTENTVSGGGTVQRAAKGIYLPDFVAGIEIRNNRFENINATGAVIMVDSNAYHHLINENYFSDNDYAIRNRSSFELNAERNWFGHPSGPFHALLNPEALGDSVNSDKPIDFHPWLTDTTLWSSADEDEVLAPSELLLTAYPNPTNSAVTATLVVPHSLDIDVKLCNVLGREVRPLWQGRVNGSKTWAFNFENDATGIYFIRALDNSGKTLVSHKLILLK